jgi:hypothetical protein
MAITSILTKTAGDIIQEALRDARIIPAEQPVQNADYARGLTALNNVSKYWQTKGPKQWLIGRAILPLVVDQRKYSLGPDGDYCTSESDFYNTTTTVALVATNTAITVATTANMVEAFNILDTDPTDSTQDWTAINSATLAISSGLVVTNVSSTAGGASYVLDTTVGITYRVRFGYTKGTSSGAVFTVLNGATVADTLTLTASAASQELTITAIDDTITFRMDNSSSTTAHTNTVYDLEYVDEASGSYIGIEQDDGTRFWDRVLNVTSSTALEILSGVASAAASGNSVYYYADQIERPLRIENIMYASSLTGSEIPVVGWSRQEYFNQPDKDSSGTVVNVYYNATLGTGELYAWQVAGNINNVIRFDYLKPMKIYSSISDEINYSEEYFLPLKWALAAEIGPQYGVKTDRQQYLEEKSAVTLSEAMDNDAEFDSIYLAPDFT